jgi:hypothetical protein
MRTQASADSSIIDQYFGIRQHVVSKCDENPEVGGEGFFLYIFIYFFVVF